MLLRGFGAYSQKMLTDIFDLTPSDLSKKILIYGAGASIGEGLIFVDPLYQLSIDEIKKLLNLKYHELENAFKENETAYRWHYFSSPHQALHTFKKNSSLFLEAWITKKKNYISNTLPTLSFPDNSFDLILCLDTLFAKPNSTLEHYLLPILEFKRIAHEIRLFPLIDQEGKLFSRIGELILELQQHELGIEIKQSYFSFQQQGDALLKMWTRTCHV